MTASLIQVLLVFALLLTFAAAVLDLRTGLIPNRLVMLGLFVGLLGNVGVGLMMRGSAGVFAGLVQSFVGACACAPVPMIMFLARGLGGGDTKLFIALGAVLGPVLGVQAQLYAFVVGALYACGLLAYEGILLRTVAASFAQVASAVLPARLRRPSTAETGRSVRFAPAIFAGTALALLGRLGGS